MTSYRSPHSPAPVCPTCGAPISAGARFCAACGRPVVPLAGQPAYPVGPPPARSSSWPILLVGIGLVLVCLVAGLAAGGFFWLARRSTSAAVTPLPPAPAATPLPSTPMATPLPPPPTQPPVTPTAVSPPSTATPPPTAAVTLAAEKYDLYVRRLDFSPANPSAGPAVQLFIAIATDIYPPAGPFFPAISFRWRPDAASAWHEETCPADSRYAQCSQTVQFSYDQAGNYTAEVEVDPGQALAETDKTNNTKAVNIEVSPAQVASAPPVDEASLAREKTALLVHPDYKKFEHAGADFSLNIPDDWQNMAEDHRGYSVSLGRAGEPKSFTIWNYRPGDALYRPPEEWIPNGQVVVPLRSTLIGHYPARQALVLDGSENRWHFYAEVTTPGRIYVLDLGAPAGDLDADILFEAATVSFRTPARCGVSVCPELLKPGEATPEPLYAPTPSPDQSAAAQPVPGAYTVFFTIAADGRPWGYVVDPQGQQHAPQDGILTIASLHLAPGDRIVLQTNAPRFSLLFDCGTSPQGFSPCDFVADTPANLPAEIRVNSGSSAYLNISGPDNWAGPRPGFESQRYPADPILRIVFDGG